MTFMLSSKGSYLISRFYFPIALIFIAIGVVVDLSNAAVIPRELSPTERSTIVDTFKRNILDHLGLEAPPEISFRNKTLAHEAIREQIKDFLRRLREIENQYDDHKIGIGAHQDSSDEAFSLHFQPSDQSLTFPIAQDPEAAIDSIKYITFTVDDLDLGRSPNKKIQFKSATLRLNIGQRRRRLRHEALKQQSLINVTVSLFLNSTPNGSRQQMTSFSLKSFILSPTRSKDFQIDLNPSLTTLSDILRTAGKSLTFRISVQELGKHIASSSKMTTSTKGSHLKKELPVHSLSSFIQIVPHLEGTILMRDQSRRKKRHTSGDRRGSGNCRRQSLYISFAEIGWDSWVIAPEGYTAYYCSGGCPRSFKAASAFTGFKALLHERNPSRIPEPTCAPSGYRPIKLLHYDSQSHGVVQTNYPNMVVSGCRCF